VIYLRGDGLPRLVFGVVFTVDSGCSIVSGVWRASIEVFRATMLFAEQRDGLLGFFLDFGQVARVAFWGIVHG